MPEICEPGGQGLLLPLSQGEHAWNKTARAVVYILVLFYFFKGVEIVANFFMDAVERIIGQKRRVFNEDKNRYVTYLVWNSTVADLTLLALGSSAPEILLSCLEMISGQFYSGDLGPSTIVGSAAFNLLVITAVCIVSIPGGEIRRIANVSVYHVTLIFGTFAYVWLLLIVQYITPNVIDLWEAIITFLMFPLLVYVSWLANKGKMNFLALEKEPDQKSGALLAQETRPSMLSSEAKEYNDNQDLKRSSHPRLSLKSKASLALVTKSVNQRASFHAQAKSEQLVIAEDAPEDKALPAGSNGKVICTPSADAITAPNGILTFRSDAMEVEGSDETQKITIEILRCNGSEGQVSCSIATEGLSGVPGYDFEEIEETTLTFEPGETMQQVEITVLPQRPTEPDDVFQLVMTDAEGDAFFNPNDDGGVGCGLLTITIRNSAAPPLDEWIVDKENMKFGYAVWKEAIVASLQIDVGEAEDGEEPPPPGPMDYIGHVVSLPFKLFFSIVTPPACLAGGWLLFTVALTWVGVVTAIICDLAGLFACCAGIAPSVTAITIVALGTSLPDTFASMSSAAKEPIADSSIVNVTGSNSVNVFLGIGIPWLAAAIYWKAAGAGGQPAKWAQKYAHLTDVMIAYPNAGFVVEAGALGFSVLIYNCVAFSALAILRIRRLTVGGELGGPRNISMASSAVFVSLWATYVGLSIWRTSSADAEVMIPVMAAVAGLFVIGEVAFELSGKGRYDPEAVEDKKASSHSSSKVEVSSPQAVAKVQDTAAFSSLALEGKAWADESKDVEPSTIGATSGAGEILKEKESRLSEQRDQPNAQEPPVDATLASNEAPPSPVTLPKAPDLEAEAEAEAERRTSAVTGVAQPEAAAPKKKKKPAASPTAKGEAKAKTVKKAKKSSAPNSTTSADTTASADSAAPEGAAPEAPATEVTS